MSTVCEPHINIGLIQIGDQFGSQYYLPYSIGVLQSYALVNLSHPQKYIFGTPLYKRMKPEAAVTILQGNEILFFSVYLWNTGLSNKIAEMYKKEYPDTTIVFGGPQVPEHSQRLTLFMEDNPFIDLACYGEGEQTFLAILENCEKKNWKNVKNVAIRLGAKIIINPPEKPITDINLIPSPYLSGVFDDLVNSYHTGYWSALIETNRGCPFSCAFCYWGAGKRCHIQSFDLDRVYAEIEWIAKHNIEFVFCCDANFGILPRDMEIVERVVDFKKRIGYPSAFSVQSTKNSTAQIFKLQKRLHDAGLQKGVNLALQSLHRPTLKAIERSNIASETYSTLLQLFNGTGIPAFSDLILGLPEESYDSFRHGVEKIIRHGQHSRIQFINLTILENTTMADATYIEHYGILYVNSRIVSHHTSLTERSGVKEFQRLVIGTSVMPPSDWVKTRILSWFLSLFYFDRLMQIPLLILDNLAGIGACEVAEHCIVNGHSFPCIGELLLIMEEKALAIQSGSPEYVSAPNLLDIWWPLDEYLLINLVREGKLNQLYEDFFELLAPFFSQLPDGLFVEALYLNRLLLKEPFLTGDINIELSYPIPEMYLAFQKGEKMCPVKGLYRYLIDRSSLCWTDWDTWMREMVWYSGKKGNYLFTCQMVGCETKSA